MKTKPKPKPEILTHISAKQLDVLTDKLDKCIPAVMRELNCPLTYILGEYSKIVYEISIKIDEKLK